MGEIDHEIFRIFRNGVNSVNKCVRDLIDVKNNILYLFDVSTGNVLVSNSSSFAGLVDFPERYQVFAPRIKIFGAPRALRASDNNAMAAVLTELGLYVVELPHISTCLMLPPYLKKCTTSCEVWMVNPKMERMPPLFIYEVLQARWHPRVQHWLLALYNDNYLRLLDAETKTMVYAMELGRHPSGSLSTLIPLHEHTVDFDFTPPAPTTESERLNKEDVAVLLLTGIGDISYAVISKEKSRLDEPMCIKTDPESATAAALAPNTFACSLLVLPSRPPMVVVSTTSGIVSHCALLVEGTPQLSYMYLKMFEEYDLGSDETKNSEEVFLLLKDPGSIYRYFVLHAAGIHAVMLPLIPVLEHFLVDDYHMLRTAMRETESVVRQLVDTSVADGPPRPPYGVGLIPVRVTMSRMVVLLADTRATVHAVDAAFPPLSDYLNKPIPAAKERRKQFSAVVSNYLLGGKSSRTSVIKVGEALKNASPEETLQFMRTYINNLKEDRVKKHSVVAELIDAKQRDIMIEYHCQLKQLERLKSARESLQQNAERIAEQYEETNEKLMMTQKRLEMVSLKINAPGRTVSEEKMRTELVTLKEKTNKLQLGLQQAQALFEHRKIQEQNPNLQEAHQRTVFLSEQRRKGIKQSLTTMSENIQEMKERLKSLSIKLNLNN